VLTVRYFETELTQKRVVILPLQPCECSDHIVTADGNPRPEVCYLWNLDQRAQRCFSGTVGGLTFERIDVHLGLSQEISSNLCSCLQSSSAF
jgi:hypothetical protein